jgi:hypothetical protein
MIFIIIGIVIVIVTGYLLIRSEDKPKTTYTGATFTDDDPLNLRGKIK